MEPQTCFGTVGISGDAAEYGGKLPEWACVTGKPRRSLSDNGPQLKEDIQLLSQRSSVVRH